VSIAYLGLGSNVDAHAHITAGIAALRETFGEVGLSPVYRSPAVGFDGNPFINLVAVVETTLQPVELKKYLNDLENRHGRLRNVPKYSDRTLDIDILLYDDLYLLSPVLELPRLEIMAFSHVLKPLADLAPDLVHPVARRTMAEIWAEFSGDRDGLELIEL
jgi:2-amino-4-hydroxy-6-hydroxymethyldihydropteridine diphosphokinase